jgi:acetyl-CoA carboxylase carboxyltransferase component
MGSTLAGNGGGNLGTVMARPRRGLRLIAVLGNYFAPWNVGLSDLAFMSKGSYCAIASPTVIQEATGETISETELGGWQVQSRIGQVDGVGEDDPDTIRLLKEVFSYLPGNVWEEPPVKWSGDPVNRRDEALLSIVPESMNRAYDMRRIIKSVVDNGKIFELQAGYGRSVVTALGRMAGYTVGIIANQPLHQAGSVESEGFVKAKRLVQLCTMFHIPLLYFQDTPGVLVGRQQEHNRVLANSMEYMIARVEADVPKVSIVVRKTYGMAYFVMNGTGPGRSFTFAWPSASIAFMGPEPAVRVTYRRELERAAEIGRAHV